MKRTFLPSTLVALTLTVAIFPSDSMAQEPIGEGAVPIGEGASGVGEGAEPVGEGAEKVGEDAVPIGEGAVPIGEDAMKIGEGAVRVGEGAVPVGEGAEKVGEGAVKVGEGAVPVGEGAEKVGEGAVPVGEGAEKVGEGAVPWNTPKFPSTSNGAFGRLPVGQGAVPVGEEATPINPNALRDARKYNRQGAMKAPETAAFFSSDPDDQRLERLEQNLAAAIAKDWTLNQAATAERRRKNDQWAAAALDSAESRPVDLLSVDWWEKHKPAGSAGSYFMTQASTAWWGASNWRELARIFAFPGGTNAFVYAYDQNLTFKNDVIYVNGQAIGSYDDYVASARQLAKSRATGNNPNSRWIPLGTFALSNSEKKPVSTHVIQLVTDGLGNIEGVYANWQNGTVQSIHGRVDLATQRVAFDIGGRNNLTLECGLTNLTGDKLRLWAHLPGSHTQTWLLARMNP